ncbi:MAG: branched-chain amino acid ABC transporter permease [Dehalococcoidia bacterium]
MLPCGTHNYSYEQDMAVCRTKTHWFWLILLFVVAGTLPLYMSGKWVGVINYIGITIIAATGLNILTGYCGQLSIGHVGFMAVGAYTSAILTGTFGIPFIGALICSGIMAGIVGLIFGVPSLRVKGFYLAIATLAAQFIIIWVIGHWTSVTGGFTGKEVPFASIGGFVFGSDFSFYYLVMGIVAISVFFALNLKRTRVGRAFVAVRDNDLAAEVMGVNLFFYKLLAFFIGCFFAGIAGSLYAHWMGFINPEQYGFLESILFVGIVIIGGLGTALGPVLGAAFIRLLDQGMIYVYPALEGAFPELPRGFTTGVAPMLFGLIIVLFLIFEPRGMAHRWGLLKASYRLWPFSY